MWTPDFINRIPSCFQLASRFPPSFFDAAIVLCGGEPPVERASKGELVWCIAGQEIRALDVFTPDADTQPGIQDGFRHFTEVLALTTLQTLRPL